MCFPMTLVRLKYDLFHTSVHDVARLFQHEILDEILGDKLTVWYI